MNTEKKIVDPPRYPPKSTALPPKIHRATPQRGLNTDFMEDEFFIKHFDY